MTTNQFKSFANGPAANVMAQNEWEILPALSSGFQSGKASSAQINKVLRQTSFIASAVAQYVAELSGRDVMDDGDIAAFVEKLKSAGSAQFLSIGKNLHEIASNGAASQAEARKSLGLGSSATQNNDAFLAAGSNLSDVPDKAHARANLGLGSAATHEIQTSMDDVGPGKILASGSAIALRSATAIASGGTVTNANDLPTNSVSFVYGSAQNSPGGMTGTILDVSGLNGQYNIQLSADYIAGNSMSFRTKNGDAGTWNGWHSLYHSGNKPTAQDTGAVSITGGDVAYLNNADHYATKDGVWPGAGSFANQLANRQALFYSSGYLAPNTFSSYAPLVKATVQTADIGYLAALSMGVLTTGASDFPKICLHAHDERGVDHVWVFDTNNDAFYSGGPISSGNNILAGAGVYESGGAVRVYSPNNPPPQQDLSAYATSSWVYQNFVNDIDHTAPVEVAFRDGASYPRATDGAFMANLAMVGGSSNVGWFVIRYTRKLVGGNWYIIG